MVWVFQTLVWVCQSDHTLSLRTWFHLGTYACTHRCPDVYDSANIVASVG